MFHSVRTRIIAMFLAVVALVVIVATAISFFMIYQQEHESDEHIVVEAASTCAAVVEFASSGVPDFKPGNSDYDECCETLRSLCGIEEMAYMYVYTVDVDANTMTYIMAVSSDPKLDSTISQARPFGTTVSMDYLSEQDRAIVSGKADSQVIAFDNDFGHMLDCIVPIGNTGMFAAASYSVSNQNSHIIMSTVSTVAYLIFVLFLLLIGQLIVLRLHVLNPLEKISESMDNFTPQHAHDFESIGIDTKDELGRIARSFEGMVGNIADYLDDIEEMAKARAQADVELDVARRIQEGMVPATEGRRVDEFDIYGFSRPARVIGGDFYDIVAIDDDHCAAVIGDVSGKGVAAALFMAISRTVIHEQLMGGFSPAQALNAANVHLYDQNPEGMFVTAVVAVIEPATGRVTLANAGHTPPLKVRGEEVEFLELDDGLLLGLFDEADIVDEHLELASGEALVLYTDGASEAVNAKREFLGETGLAASVKAGLPVANAKDVVDLVAAAVDGFAAEVEQFDDLTAISFMNCSDGQSAEDEGHITDDMIEIEVKQSEFRTTIKDAIMSVEGADKKKRRASLAVEEAFTNVVSYSKATHIWFRAVIVESGILEFDLVDDGEPFNPFMNKVGPREFEELENGGMGISLVENIAKKYGYRRLGGKNILSLTFDVASDSE